MKEDYRVIAKVLISAAIALGAAVGVAAPVMADPSTDPNPNPFTGVECAECTVGLVGSQTKAAPVIDPDQMTQAVQSGISEVQAAQGQQ
jgi:hypothetical protein